MTEIIFLSAEVTAIQITNIRLYCLPFNREISAEKILKLRGIFIKLSVASFILNAITFSSGITFQSYKVLLTLNWLTYIFVTAAVIRENILRHIFVAGMQGLWTFMLHSTAAMCVAAVIGEVNPTVLTLHAAFYLLLFAVLFPIEQKFFTNLFPSKQFFEDKSLRWGISILPVAIFIGTIMPIANVTFLLSSWQGRLSRMILPLFFFIMYRSIILSTRNFEEHAQKVHLSRLMRQQLSALHEQNFLMKASNIEVEKLREDLNSAYSVIDKLIDEGKISAAMEYIREQDKLLDKTVVKKYCDAPLINAALSIYFHRAEESNIKVHHKINLPTDFETDENELALIMSNLLENAVQASERQKNNRREISVIVQHNDNQFVLEISNLYDKKIKIGKNSLPVAEKEGHGLGLTSLLSFAKKYDAYVDFSQKNGKVELLMYWEDKAPSTTPLQTSPEGILKFLDYL